MPESKKSIMNPVFPSGDFSHCTRRYMGNGTAGTEDSGKMF